MKKLIFPVLVLAVAAAFYEQNTPQPNIWITVISIIVFMLGMMWLSSKTPSKNQHKEDDEI
jgi:FtsH-binding integral membrane protein